MRARAALLLVVVALFALPFAGDAQRGVYRRAPGDYMFLRPGPAPRYDSRFMLARLYYENYPGWAFDWPNMEEHLGKILDELTVIRGNHEQNNILRMDDPALLKFPMAWLSEPGYWFPKESEVLGLRAFLNKGGFLIVDDFHYAEEWHVFEAAMMKVLPRARIERLTLSHPVFNSFFSIKSLDVPYPGRLGEMGLMGEFYGIHDSSVPSRPLMVVINYNIDIGDYIEWSPTGYYAVAPSNEAYKFAINYLMYGLTH